MHRHPGWGAALAVALAMSAATASAQRATGFVMNSPEEVAGLPVTPPYRNLLPRQVDLRPLMPPIGDQGQQGSCTAWATSYAAMSVTFNREVRALTPPGFTPPSVRFSPAYLYNQIHRGNCQGTDYVRALNIVRDKGLAFDEEFPYSDKDCAALPATGLVSEARARRLIRYATINPNKANALDKIRGALYQQRPVLFSMNAGGDEGSLQSYRGGIFDQPIPDEEGGHAMVLVGYDDDEQTFLVANSWGEDWGEQGYMRIRYPALLKSLSTYVKSTEYGPLYVIDEVNPQGVKALAVTLAPPPAPPPPEPAPAPAPAPAPVETLPEPAPAPAPTPNDLPSAWSPQRWARELPQWPAAKDCGQVSVQVEGEGLKLTGYVPSRAALDQAFAAFNPPAGLRLDSSALEELPWPQCEVRLDYSPHLQRERWAIELGPLSKPGLAAAGEALQIKLKTPGGQAYLYAFYIQAEREGNVLPLYQPRFDAKGRPLPETLKPLLDLNQPLAGIRRDIVVTAPFGPEALLLVAARKPLFPERLAPSDWNERYLLTRLRLALGTLKADGNLLATDYVLLRTGEAS